MIEAMYHTPMDLPPDPPDGVYVIVDVWNFSTTVLTLLDSGAEYVHVASSPEDALHFKQEHEDALAATEPEPDGSIPEGFDFCNSPYEARQIASDGKSVSIFSDTGAQTIDSLAGTDTTIYTGSTLNAQPLGEHLNEHEESVQIVSAGYHGRRAVEDTIAASMISRYTVSDEMAEVDETVYHDGLSNCEAGAAAMNGSRRMRNDYSMAHNFNTLAVVPYLDDAAFADVSGENSALVSNSSVSDFTG